MGMTLTVDYSELVEQLDNMTNKAGKAISFGLYDCAAVVKNAAQQEALGLPFKGSTVAQISQSIGVADFRDTDTGKQTSISSDGYFAESGFPIPFFVREVENGTSRIAANPFIQRAFARVKGAAEAAGNATAENIIKNEAM